MVILYSVHGYDLSQKKLRKNVCLCSNMFLYIYIGGNSGLTDDRSFVLTPGEKTQDLKNLIWP